MDKLCFFLIRFCVRQFFLDSLSSTEGIIKKQHVFLRERALLRIACKPHKSDSRSGASTCMLQVAEENVASELQVPGVSELEALGTLRSKNNMFEFLCGKHYLSMSNTICFLWLRSSCFLCIPRFFWWGEHHGWKLASPTLLPENGSLCFYPLKLAQGPGPNNPEVNVLDSFFNLLGSRCEAAEMQAETVKVEILQSGEAP